MILINIIISLNLNEVKYVYKYIDIKFQTSTKVVSLIDILNMISNNFNFKKRVHITTIFFTTTKTQKNP